MPSTRPPGVLTNLKISVRITVLLVIVCVVLVCLGVYSVLPQSREHVRFVAALLGGAAAVYSAYYVGEALRLKLRRDRQEESFRILELLNRPEFVQVRHFLEAQVEGHESLSEEELFKRIDCDEVLDNAVTVVLGILEDASIAIQHGFVDEDVVYLSLYTIVARNYSGLQGYIRQLRKKRSPSLFIEFERLSVAWCAGKRLCDGRPVPAIAA